MHTVNPSPWPARNRAPLACRLLPAQQFTISDPLFRFLGSPRHTNPSIPKLLWDPRHMFRMLVAVTVALGPVPIRLLHAGRRTIFPLVNLQKRAGAMRGRLHLWPKRHQRLKDGRAKQILGHLLWAQMCA